MKELDVVLTFVIKSITLLECRKSIILQTWICLHESRIAVRLISLLISQEENPPVKILIASVRTGQTCSHHIRLLREVSKSQPEEEN